jgi:hypothetical protein
MSLRPALVYWMGEIVPPGAACRAWRLHGVGTLAARRPVAELRRGDGSQAADGRRLVARHAGAEQARHDDRRDDADDRHDDQKLDECEAFVLCPFRHHSHP